MQVLWLRYLTEIDEATTEVPDDLLEIPQVKKAIEVLKESAFTTEELAGYQKFWDMVSTEKTYFSSAERRGLAKGRAEGRAEGRVEGRAEGRAEAMLETAKKMLAMGLDRATVAQVTGLDMEQIRQIDV
jgi:predicted transposase/invertase (TIGR01784 family)